MKSQEEVDALALYLFGYDDKGRQMVRESDEVVSGIPGLEGLTLLEDVLDEAIDRAAAKPGWAGVVPMPAQLDTLRGAASAAWGREPVAG